MEIRYATSPVQMKESDTEALRNEYLIENLMQYGKLTTVYTHVDRMIIGGVVPSTEAIQLEASQKEMGVVYFLERREIGILNIGDRGVITVDGQEYLMNSKDCLYVGMGSRDIRFLSQNPNSPARYYFVSTPAHRTYPTVKMTKQQATATHLGGISSSNERTIYKYVHTEGIQSCQLVMGMTELEPGNMWNTMPCHTHIRRSEVYFYFSLPDDAVVLHLMGEPQETRHLVVRNEQAVISPSWSIHSGVGTHHYTFIWAMGGENQLFNDQDMVPMQDLR